MQRTMCRFFVYMLVALSQLHFGLGLQNVTCKRRVERFYEPSYYLTNHCFIEKIPRSDIQQETFSFQVDYMQPSDVLWVEFAPTAGMFRQANASDVEYIPKGIFTKFLDLAKFEMATNIRDLNPGDFINAKRLKVLKLSDNKLQIIRKGVFSPFSEELLTGREALPLQFLEEIFLDFNEISEIEPKSFRGLPSLTFITLEHNKLGVIREMTFSGLPNLQTILLHRNNIETIVDDAVDLPRLKLINLGQNELQHFEQKIFDRLPELSGLVMEENKIQRLSSNPHNRLSNLTFLWLDNNNLEHIGESLYQLPKMRYIYLKGNKIKDIDLIKFAHMPHLRTLDLTDTNFTLSSVDLKQEEDWSSSLERLDFKKNNLSSTNELNKLRMFPNLKIVSLAGNKLENFEFDGNRTLKDVLPRLENLNIYAIDWSSEYRSEIERKYNSINVTLYLTRFSDAPELLHGRRLM